ncbi:MAG: MlaE family lipid ABC transporter permease subunit [Desulfobacteraceae bacterium]|nr:MlaE family lipid ABC transporter permease subunit [Desulfobacteraceae bacterium]
MSQPPQFTITTATNITTLCLSGRLDTKGVAAVWQRVTIAVGRAKSPTLIINLGEVDYMDMAGAAFISHLKNLDHNGTAKERSQVNGLKSAYTPLLVLAEKTDIKPAITNHLSPHSFVEQTGKNVADFLYDAKTFISFIGELIFAMVSSLKAPKNIRWGETFLMAERAGVDALPIVGLISFIVGLVMAFQAAIPMKMFGAELYVANLIGIATVRELGPLMTAIVLAGRSASAFAAEIGTMKINEEIDALTVMGMDPVKFLILPRVIALTMVTPLLTIFANLVGILGGAVVILSLGYPLVAYYNQVVNFVTWQDFTGGIIKCFVFGVLIAATGCIRGYQTQMGSSAVGQSTTRAVVSSIVLIAVFDGIFSIMYYYMGV